MIEQRIKNIIRLKKRELREIAKRLESLSQPGEQSEKDYESALRLEGEINGLRQALKCIDIRI